MGQLTLILGGARSGKSSYAEQLALQRGEAVTYIATAQALDDEMSARIASHRQKRPDGWQTREIPSGVGKELIARPPQSGIVILDCLTLLVSNLLMTVTDKEGNVDEDGAVKLVEGELDRLIEAIQSLPNEWIIVTNEVGMGLVPPYPLGRVYRDLLGWANQRLATHARKAVFMIAGIPMLLLPITEHS
jgi:adenosylcobinamide kinase/adenosylcobinamide-phosphate guanylyltransferase